MFRVSQEEFDRLQQFWLGTDYRSLSDMVRVALNAWVASGGGRFDAPLEFRLRELEQRLAGLTVRIEELSESRAVAVGV